jgi:hypothetical protein
VRGDLVRAPVLLVAATLACGAVAVWAASGGRADSNRSLVPTSLSAIQTAQPNEFSTPKAAVQYLVEQVRTQNVDAATRVLPIAAYEQKATFEGQANRLQSVAVNGFFPGQPFSKLYYELGFLENNYTLFAISLLDPTFLGKGVVPLRSSQAVKQFAARFDPNRLAHIQLQSFSPTYSSSTKLNGLQQLGVNKIAGANIVIGGLGTPRHGTVDLARYGTNWLVNSVRIG